MNAKEKILNQRIQSFIETPVLAPTYCSLSEGDTLKQYKEEETRDIFGETHVHYRWVDYAGSLELMSFTKGDCVWRFGSIDPSKDPTDILNLNGVDPTDSSTFNESFYIQDVNNICKHEDSDLPLSYRNRPSLLDTIEEHVQGNKVVDSSLLDTIEEHVHGNKVVNSSLLEGAEEVVEPEDPYAILDQSNTSITIDNGDQEVVEIPPPSGVKMEPGIHSGSQKETGNYLGLQMEPGIHSGSQKETENHLRTIIETPHVIHSSPQTHWSGTQTTKPHPSPEKSLHESKLLVPSNTFSNHSTTHSSVPMQKPIVKTIVKTPGIPIGSSPSKAGVINLYSTPRAAPPKGTVRRAPHSNELSPQKPVMALSKGAVVPSKAKVKVLSNPPAKSVSTPLGTRLASMTTRGPSSSTSAITHSSVVRPVSTNYSSTAHSTTNHSSVSHPTRNYSTTNQPITPHSITPQPTTNQPTTPQLTPTKSTPIPQPHLPNYMRQTKASLAQQRQVEGTPNKITRPPIGRVVNAYMFNSKRIGAVARSGERPPLHGAERSNTVAPLTGNRSRII